MANRQHILMLPLMAQGHLIPFLSLAKLIDRRQPGRFTITLLTTPLNARNLQHAIPAESTNILLRELPFCSDDHGLRLPPDSENTDSLHHHHIIRLFHASESLAPPHSEGLVSDVERRDGRPPLCIIADVFFEWNVEVARGLGVFHSTLTTCGVYGTAAYFSLWLHLPHAGTDAEEFHIPGLPTSAWSRSCSSLRQNLNPWRGATDVGGEEAAAVRVRCVHAIQGGEPRCVPAGLPPRPAAEAAGPPTPP